jgi:N-acetylglucosamine kinase-like BadF-type ATPase
MILIADSGSTKTDWRMIAGDGSISQANTSGMNPYHSSPEQLLAVLQDELQPQLSASPTQIFFYGAGCTTDTRKEEIARALRSLYPQAQLEVNNDQLAAARALCGREEGIACILGTGANTCLYDGRVIVDNIPPMGYIIGDEGSGSHIGKELLNRYFRRDLPADLREKLEKRFDMSQENVLEQLYRKPLANRYLAGFSRFVFQNLKHPYLMRMVYDIFILFFDQTICRYQQYESYKIHFTGSVAFYYGNLLRQVANDKGLRVFNILENPIAGLTLFHQESKQP